MRRKEGQDQRREMSSNVFLFSGTKNQACLFFPNGKSSVPVEEKKMGKGKKKKQLGINLCAVYLNRIILKIFFRSPRQHQERHTISAVSLIQIPICSIVLLVNKLL